MVSKFWDPGVCPNSGDFCCVQCKGLASPEVWVLKYQRRNRVADYDEVIGGNLNGT
jgi:hypothetical protein